MADDLDKEAHDSDFDFDDAEDFGDDGSQSLGNVVQNNMAVKIAIIAGVFVLIIGGLILFGGGDDEEVRSKMGVEGAGDVREIAGGEEELPPSYREALEQYNQEGEEEAYQQDTSFIPVPTDPTQKTGIVVPSDSQLEEDPLERWRILQEQAARQKEQQALVEQQNPQIDENADERRQQAVQELAEGMITSMDQLSSLSYVRNLNTVDVTEEEYYQELEEQARERAELAAENAAAAAEAVAADNVKVLISEGEIEYAQLLIQANSDIPGPVLAQIVTGPLSGNRIVGTFTREEKYLVITFETIIIDGQSVSIEAVAVDPATNLTGVATEVDNRYFKRLVLPVAANFIEGLAGAIAETQVTTTTTTDVAATTETNNQLDTEEEVATAIEDAGEELSDFVEEEADRTEILVRVDAGTPIGILFLEPVLEEVPASAGSNSITSQFVN